MNQLSYWDLLRSVWADPVIVAGNSMRPSLKPGDRLYVDRLTYRLRRPRRGDLTVALPRSQPGLWIIKRVVGLPHENVALVGNQLTVNGVPQFEPYLADCPTLIGRFDWQLGCEQYLLLGDNRAESDDSRLYGPFSRALLRGPARR